LKKQSKISELRWPIGIVLGIFGVIGLSIWTIEQANIKPVVMDDYYFEDLHYVEQHIDEIQMKQIGFDKKYNLSVPKDPFHVGTNNLKITLTTKENAPVSDANFTVKITKPDTSKYDKFIKVTSVKDGTYTFEPFEIEKIGRWQIKTKVTTPDDLTSFSVTDLNATK